MLVECEMKTRCWNNNSSTNAEDNTYPSSDGCIKIHHLYGLSPFLKEGVNELFRVFSTLSGYLLRFNIGKDFIFIECVFHVPDSSLR